MSKIFRQEKKGTHLEKDYRRLRENRRWAGWSRWLLTSIAKVQWPRLLDFLSAALYYRGQLSVDLTHEY